MARKTADSIRFQISLPRATADRLDALCARLGVTRSTFISLSLGESLDAHDAVTNLISQRTLAAVGHQLSGPTS